MRGHKREQCRSATNSSSGGALWRKRREEERRQAGERTLCDLSHWQAFGPAGYGLDAQGPVEEHFLQVSGGTLGCSAQDVYRSTRAHSQKREDSLKKKKTKKGRSTL